MSEATKEKLREAYRKRMAGMVLEEPTKKPNESSVSEEQGLRVTKVCMNPRLVEGDSDAGVRSLVDVGRNHTMAVGDEIVVRRHPEMMDVLLFVRMADVELAVDHVGLPRDKRRVFR